MLKLIKLELQRVNLRPYLITSIISAVVLLAFTYFIACVAQIEQEEEFMTYDNIFLFTNAISILLFGVLSATMYAKLIINEYSGNRLTLLFSYPVGRRKVFTAKILIISLFVVSSMLFATILPIFIFTATESFVPIVPDAMTVKILINTVGTVAVSLIAVNAIGLLAMRIGFIKKSVSATLVSTFIFSSIYGNIVTGSAGNFIISTLVIIVSLFVIVTVFTTLSYKINRMEVD